MEQVIAELAREFGLLDFSAENARLMELRADIERAEAALAAANERCAKLSQEIRADRAPSGQAVADALVADAPPSEAAKINPSIQHMEDERASLQSGLEELRRRIDSWKSEILRVRVDARSRVAVSARPLVDAIAAEARDAATRLQNAYAALYALNVAIGVDQRVLNQLVAGADGVTGPEHLLPWRERIPVPDLINQVLDVLTDKGEALTVQRIVASPTPA